MNSFFIDMELEIRSEMDLQVASNSVAAETNDKIILSEAIAVEDPLRSDASNVGNYSGIAPSEESSSSNANSSFNKQSETNCVLASNNSFCVICTDIIDASGHIVEEEIVMYFVEKFFPFSLLQSLKSDNADDRSTHEIFDRMRNQWGSPVTWISFCTSCIHLIKAAKELFIKISALETQLKHIRETVTNEVKRSFKSKEDSITSNDQCCFDLFRKCIHQMSVEKPQVIGEIINPLALVEVKSECPSDMDEFEESGIQWITEVDMDGLVGTDEKQEGSSSLDSIQLADIIIDPKCEKPDERLLVATLLSQPGNYDELDNSKKFSFELSYNEDIESTERLESPQPTINHLLRKTGRQTNIIDENNLLTQKEPDKSDNSSSLINGKLDLFNATHEEKPQKKSTKRMNKKSQSRNRTNKHEASLDPGKSIPNASLSIEIRDHRGMGKCSLESKTCPVCKRVFLNPSKMAVHYNIKHDRKILFNCELCNRGFMRKDYLREHMKIHLTPEEKIRERTMKERGVRKPRDRTKSKVAEASADRPSCLICKTSFEDSVHLQRHINYFHGKTEGYTCEVCRKKFQWKDALRKHLRLHEGTKQFKCDYEGCESAFYYKKHLEVHQRIHTGAKDFLCAHCGISFRHEWSFNRHNIFKHHKVTSKTYLCDTCGKSFKIKSHLDQHLQSKSHGGNGLKRRTRSRAKPTKTKSSTSNSNKLVSNPEKEADADIAVSNSTTASSMSHRTTTTETLSSVNHSTSDTTQMLPSFRATSSFQLPTLVLASNLESISNLQVHDRQDSITLREMNEMGSSHDIPTSSCNSTQLSIPTSSSRDNEYLQQYISSMTSSVACSNSSITLTLQQQPLQLKQSNQQSSDSIAEEPSTITPTIQLPLPNATINLGYHQNNYPNQFSFVIAESGGSNDDSNSLMHNPNHPQ